MKQRTYHPTSSEQCGPQSVDCGEQNAAQPAPHAASIEQWYAIHHALAVGYVRRRGIPDPEDVVQEAVFRAWVTYNSDSGNFRFWVWIFLNRVIVNRLRKIYRIPIHVSLDEANDWDLATEGEAWAGIPWLPVDALLGQVPLEDAALLRAHYLEDTRIATLAARLGYEEGAAKMRLARARWRLRNLLRREGCQCCEDAPELAAQLAERRVVLSPPRPAKPQPRPRCKPNPTIPALPKRRRGESRRKH